MGSSGVGERKKEEGGTAMLAGYCIVWPNGVTACGPGPNPGVSLRFKVSSHLYIWPTIQKALCEDSGMHIYFLHIKPIFCIFYAKYAIYVISIFTRKMQNMQNNSMV